jgi:CheY-like chemotaxis protein
MSDAKKFLVVDTNPDGQELLIRTLSRVFPQSAVLAVQDFEEALRRVEEEKFDAVLSHRAVGADPVTLIRGIRAVNTAVPILAVSGVDRAAEVIPAGANRFLNYDEWLRVGTVVAEVLADRKTPGQAGRGLFAS